MDETVLDQIRFINILYGACILSDGCSQDLKSHRSAMKLLNDGAQNTPVCLIQAGTVHIQLIQHSLSNSIIDFTVMFNLCKITNPFQKPVCQTRRTPGALGYLQSTLFIHGYSQYLRRS